MEAGTLAPDVFQLGDAPEVQQRRMVGYQHGHVLVLADLHLLLLEPLVLEHGREEELVHEHVAYEVRVLGREGVHYRQHLLEVLDPLPEEDMVLPELREVLNSARELALLLCCSFY